MIIKEKKGMTKQLTNLEMFNYISNISQELMQKVTGKVAYALAYNLRKMQNELKEYMDFRNELITKYSKELEDGRFGIDIKSVEYQEFIKELAQYDNIIHVIELILIDPEDIYSTELNADDIFTINFMIGDV